MASKNENVEGSRGRMSSPGRRMSSPVGRPASPGRRMTSPVRRPLSPVRRPLSPVRRPLSPTLRTPLGIRSPTLWGRRPGPTFFPGGRGPFPGVRPMMPWLGPYGPLRRLWFSRYGSYAPILPFMALPYTYYPTYGYAMPRCVVCQNPATRTCPCSVAGTPGAIYYCNDDNHVWQFWEGGHAQHPFHLQNPLQVPAGTFGNIDGVFTEPLVVSGQTDEKKDCGVCVVIDDDEVNGCSDCGSGKCCVCGKTPAIACSCNIGGCAYCCVDCQRKDWRGGHKDVHTK